MNKSIHVQYVEYVSALPYETIIRSFEEATGTVEDGGYREAVSAAQTPEEFERAIEARESTSGFMRFLALDHGVWMKKFEGATTRGRVYTLGNPLLARTMLRHDMAAGLNVPVRVYIYEGSDRKARLAYHLPSSLMLVYDNEEVIQASLKLDDKLARLAETVTAARA